MVVIKVSTLLSLSEDATSCVSCSILYALKHDTYLGPYETLQVHRFNGACLITCPLPENHLSEDAVIMVVLDGGYYTEKQPA